MTDRSYSTAAQAACRYGPYLTLRPGGGLRSAPATERGLCMKVSVVKETAPSERRVALVPEAVVKLRSAGPEVLVQSGAGDAAWHTDDSYAEAGATVVSRADALAADVVLMVGKPDTAAVSVLRPGQVVIGLLAPLTDPDLTAAL